MKGALVNAYSINSESLTDEMLCGHCSFQAFSIAGAFAAMENELVARLILIALFVMSISTF